jgi:exoribonuclease R
MSHTPEQRGAEFRREIGRLRSEKELPAAFAREVLSAAESAVASTDWRAGRVDLTDINFVTLDPATSVDLDQAFSVSVDGDDIVLHYALADIAAFAPSGGVIEAESWRRGVTVYLPDGRVPVYPPVLCEHAASLLPDGPRPAIVLVVAVALDGTPTLRSADRAIVASRAKLAYESTSLDDLDPAALELHRRITANEKARGATKVDFPEQHVEMDPSAPAGVNLVLRPMLPSEEANSSLSLAANFAVASLQLEAKTGLFRIMPEADEYRQRSLRRMAKALGIDWPKSMTLREVMPTLDPSKRSHKELLVEARRSGRGASYAMFDAANLPFHSALAAPYAHATAPMRRLADRYVLEHVLALVHGTDTTTILSSLSAMPTIMAKADGRAASLDRDVIDLVEALELEGNVGAIFPASVLDAGHHGTVVQLIDPPVRARVPGPSTVEEGSAVTVRLLSVDVAARSVRFELVPPSA